MPEIKRIIFGKNILIKSEDKSIHRLLSDELSIYPEYQGAREADLTVEYCAELEAINTGSRNPSIHHTFESGFTMSIVNANIRFLFVGGDLKRIEFSIPSRKKKGLNKIANRWMSMQFTSNEEAIGQILHEHILVPSVFFDSNMAMLHASGVGTPEGKTILIGGTGGIGKTSIEMELCLEHNCAFICDDIAVVSDSGIVHPNLSYPKVYGYNLEGNEELKQKVLKENSLASDVHWWMHSKRGINFVRRRISPEQLYGQYVSDPQKLDKYYVFIREHRKDVVVEQITVEHAAELSLHVIYSEYSDFFDHIHWDNYNAKASSRTSTIPYLPLIKKMEADMLNALMYCKNYILRIPINMDHNEFKRSVAEILLAK